MEQVAPKKWSAAPATSWPWREHWHPLLAISLIVLVFGAVMLAGITFSGVGAQMYMQFPWAGVIDSEYLVGGRGFYQSAQAAVSFPSGVFVAEALRSGQLPLWVPYSFGGRPAAALDFAQYLYPPYLVVLLLFDPHHQHNLLLILHLLIAGGGMYGLLRSYGANAHGSVFGALVWQFNGFSGFWFSRIDVVIAAAWLPVGLLLARLAVQRGSFRYAAFAGAALGMGCLGGSLVLACLGVLVTLSYLAATLVGPLLGTVRQRRWRDAVRLLSVPLVGLGSGAGVSAAVWLPRVRAYVQGESSSLSLTGPSAQPLAWPDVLQSLVRPASAATAPGELPLGHIQPLVPDFASLVFVGLPALILAVVALAVLVLHRDRRALWAVVMLVALVLGVESGWLPRRPWAMLDGASTLPYAEIYLFGFGMALLAGLGLNWLTVRLAKVGRAALMGVLVSRAVILVEAWQLLAFAFTSSPMQPAEHRWAYPETALLTSVQELQGDRRVLPLDQTLTGRSPLMFGIRSVAGDPSDLSPELDRLWHERLTVPQDASGTTARPMHVRLPSALLRTLSVGLIVGQPGTTLVADTDQESGTHDPEQERLRLVYAGSDGVIYQQADALPRVMAVPQIVSVPDAATALGQVIDPAFDASRVAVVIGDPPAAAGVPSVNALTDATVAGGDRASPPMLQISPNPPPRGTTHVTLRWDAGAASDAQVWVSQNGQPETIFASGATGTADIPWMTEGNTYTFRLYAAPDRATVLETHDVVFAPQVATPVAPPVATPVPVPTVRTVGLQASPNPLPRGTTRVTLSWDAGAASNAQVWVSPNGQPEALFAGGATGTTDIPWITEGSTYTFRLYAAPDRATLLDELELDVTIPAPFQETGLHVEPNPLPAGREPVTVRWSAGTEPSAQVWVSQNGKPETLLTSGRSGSVTLPWVDTGHTYAFRLYGGRDRAQVLGSVLAARGRASVYTSATAPVVVEPAPWQSAGPVVPTIVRDTLNEVEIAVVAPSTTMLVLNDTWAPGWRAYVNGTEQPVLRVNYLSRGVVVPAGAHRVVFQYRPTLVVAGITVSLVWSTLLLGLLVAQVLRARPWVETPIPFR